MDASIRPWLTSGVALVGASAIALAPITPVPTSTPVAQVKAATTAVTMQFNPTALDIPYILSLPIIRGYVRNWAQEWAVWFAGFGQAGVGLAQSVFAIPGVTAQILQQVLTLDFVGAFNTFTTAVRDSVVAVGKPLLDSFIWVNQKTDLVNAALRAAIPQAIIDVTNGFLLAGNAVVTSAIEGTQNLIAAVLTLNLSNIVNAAVDGTKDFVSALGTGAGAIVGGIESAQKAWADALAVEPPPLPFSTTEVSTMRTFSETNTLSVSGGAEEPSFKSAKESAPEAVSTAPTTEAVVPEVVAPEVESTTDAPKPTPVVETKDAAPTASSVPEKPEVKPELKLDLKDVIKSSDLPKATAGESAPGADTKPEAKDKPDTEKAGAVAGAATAGSGGDKSSAKSGDA